MNNSFNDGFYYFKNSIDKLREVKEKVDRMSLKEQTGILLSKDFYNTDGCESLAPLKFSKSFFEYNSKQSQGISFISAIAMGSSFDRQLIEQIGNQTANFRAIDGCDVVVCPSANIIRYVLCANNLHYFSEDPYLTGEMCASFAVGAKGFGVPVAIDQYLDCSRVRNYLITNCVIDIKALNEIYVEAARIAVSRSKPACVIVSANMINGEYVAQSKSLVGAIRNNFDFDGIIASDKHSVEDRTASLVAGVDLDLSGELSRSNKQLEQSVVKRKLDKQLVANSVAELAVLSDYIQNNKAIPAVTDQEKNIVLSQNAIEQSAVLLKNDENFLPFSKNESIAVIGNFERYSEQEDLFDYLESQNKNISFAKGFNQDGSTNDILLNQAKQIAKKSNKTLIIVGTLRFNESYQKSDRQNLCLCPGMLKLIYSVLSVSEDVAVVLTSHEPCELPFLDRIKSLLAVDFSACGINKALYNLIFGNCSPSGKLSVSWNSKLSEYPTSFNSDKDKQTFSYREGIYVGYRYFLSTNQKPLFCFGYGLSYSNFAFSNLKLDRPSLSERGELCITFYIENTGSYVAGEVAQIYISKKGENYKQLKGFEKIFLLPGEKRAVEMKFQRSSFARYNMTTKKWQVEPGDYDIMLATDCQTTIVSKTVSLLGKQYTDDKKYFYAKDIKMMSEKSFFELAKFIKKHKQHGVYTINSTLGEISKCSAGLAFKNLLKDSETFKMHDIENIPLRTVLSHSNGEVSKRSITTLISFCNKDIKATIKNMVSPQ